MTTANDGGNQFKFPQPATSLFPSNTPPYLQPPMPSPFPGLASQLSPVLPPFPMVYGQKLPQPLGNVGAASSAVIVKGAMLKCDKAKDAAARVKLIVDDKGYDTGLGHKAMDTDTKPENFEGDFGTCTTDDKPCEMLQMAEKWTEIDESQTAYYNGQTMMGLTIDSLLVCTKGGGSISIEENGQGWQTTSQANQVNSDRNSWEKMLYRVGGTIGGAWGDANAYLDFFKVEGGADITFLGHNFLKKEYASERHEKDLLSDQQTEPQYDAQTEEDDPDEHVLINVEGHVGGSAVAAHTEGEIGNRWLGLTWSADGKNTEVGANTEITGSFDKEGINAYVSGGAIAAFLDGDVGASLKFLGIFEVGIEAGGFIGGAGAEAKVGLENNKLTAKVAAAVGIGGSVGASVGFQDDVFS